MKAGVFIFFFVLKTILILSEFTFWCGESDNEQSSKIYCAHGNECSLEKKKAGTEEGGG